MVSTRSASDRVVLRALHLSHERVGSYPQTRHDPLDPITAPCRHCLRSGLSVRLPFHATPSQTVGHPRESVYGISPSVGWSNGTGEPDAGTIFADILRLPTGRLAPASA